MKEIKNIINQIIEDLPMLENEQNLYEEFGQKTFNLFVDSLRKDPDNFRNILVYLWAEINDFNAFIAYINDVFCKESEDITQAIRNCRDTFVSCEDSELEFYEKIVWETYGKELERLPLFISSNIDYKKIGNDLRHEFTFVNMPDKKIYVFRDR